MNVNVLPCACVGVGGGVRGCTWVARLGLLCFAWFCVILCVPVSFCEFFVSLVLVKFTLG